MTDTERSLLDAVLERPDDDWPRGIMADWYDENGQPERAEFIRVQIELAKYDRNITTCKTPEDCYYANKCGGNCGVDERDMICCPLRKRNDELSANCFDWFEMPDGMAPGSISWKRGFVDAVSLSLAAFMGGPCECTLTTTTRRIVSGYGTKHCPACQGSGRVLGLVDAIERRWPVTQVNIVDAVIHPSGGNDTYYVGNLGIFPKEYWRRLEGHTTRAAAMTALSNACVDLMRERAGLPKLRWSN